jgi:carbon-monoxide dehydrogenase medium subunit
MGRPGHVVDIGGIDGLADIAVNDGAVTLGPLVRHEQAKRSAELAEHAPLISETMPWVPHRAIRTQGTVLGSIAHADPAAEMPAVVLATGATLTATSTRGSREIAAEHFFQGYLDTALEADEILTGVTFPAWPANAAGSLTEVARRHGDYALVGLAIRIEVTNLEGRDVVTDAALAFFGAASTAIRVPVAEEMLVDSPLTSDTFDAVAQIVASELEPPKDIHGTTAYRKHLAGVITRRGLQSAAAKIGVPA